MTRSATGILALALLCLSVAVPRAGAETLSDEQVAGLSRAAMLGDVAASAAAVIKLAARNKPDAIATLVLALRYRRDNAEIKRALTRLTATKIENWRDAMLWQEAHPEVVPHDSYRAIKLEMFSRIDPNFLKFLGGDKARRKNLKIRLEEITWGGVPVDGIPSLDNPKLIAADKATYLRSADLVFGVEINGDIRAYPLRIMGWHEMFNETIGGVPVALAYCTLCGAGILFETRVEGRKKPFVFGSSGFLYRSNKLMFDRETHSLWNQFTGKPVSGPLRATGIELKIRPVVITSWGDWKKRHPGTKALSLETGHRRNYGPGVVYHDYFASPDLMFPAIVRNENELKRKDYVFGIRTIGAARAWPLGAFKGGVVINDAVGNRKIVLIGDAGTRTVRAYDRNGMTFAKAAKPGHVRGPGGDWAITETALNGPGGAKFARVPGHISYWFAWDGYLGVNASLYKPGEKP